MPKPKVCPVCSKEFSPSYSLLQRCCSIPCARKYNTEKEVKKRVKQMKKDLRTHKDYLQILQKVFNEFIRLRDAKEPCISCRCEIKGSGHASHFFPTTKQFLRFNEDNVHRSCEQCNLHFAGNLTKYAYYLPKKIGWERFEDLHAQANNELKLSIPEIQELIIKYRNKTKQLKQTI